MKAKILKILDRNDILFAQTEVDLGEGRRSLVMVPLNSDSNDDSFKAAVSAAVSLKIRKKKGAGRPSGLDEVKAHFESKIGKPINLGNDLV